MSKRKSPEEVELNLAAMLDMAFRILTFFVLTFKPAPVEGQVALRMPPPQPLAIQAGKAQAGSTEENKDPVAGFNTLAIWLDAGDDGHPAPARERRGRVPAGALHEGAHAPLHYQSR